MIISFVKEREDILLDEGCPSIQPLAELIKNVLFLIEVKASHKGMTIDSRQYYNCDYSQVLSRLTNKYHTITIT